MSEPRLRVVTVARECGSGGAAIAARLDERVDPWTRRLGRVLWRGGVEAVAVVDENDVVDSGRVAALSARIVEEAAVATILTALETGAAGPT